MIKVERGEGFFDYRGLIQDLLTDVKLDSVTLIRTNAGSVRGNHFHAETQQWTYVISGGLRVVTRVPGQEEREEFALPGCLFLSPANEHHAWEAVEDCEVLVFTTGPRSGADYESDTIRLLDDQRLL
jgi:quercetin dioxygenase-like cupin family protein